MFVRESKAMVSESCCLYVFSNRYISEAIAGGSSTVVYVLNRQALLNISSDFYSDIKELHTQARENVLLEPVELAFEAEEEIESKLSSAAATSDTTGIAVSLINMNNLLNRILGRINRVEEGISVFQR